MTDGEHVLTTWTIYERPLDHPTMYVLVAWGLYRGDTEPRRDQAWVVPTAERARELLPDNVFCIYRSETDDPSVLESWI